MARYAKTELFKRLRNAGREGWTSQKIRDLIDSIWNAIKKSISVAINNLTFVSEIPEGIVDGENKTFTLSNTPKGDVALHLYPVTRLLPGTFTVTGNTIVLGDDIIAPADDEQLVADYWYVKTDE